VEQKFSDLR